MSLTIQTPQSGSTFGPGFSFQLTSTVTGPLAPDSFWLIELSSPSNENVIVRKFIPWTSPTVAGQLINSSSTIAVIAERRTQWPNGGTARFHVELEEIGVGIIESANVEGTLDLITGQANELAEVVRVNASAPGTGLTEDEHNAVLQTNVGVIALAGINPLDLVGDLANAFQSNPPLHFGSLSTTYDLVGDGEMPDIGDLFHTKLGIYFVADIPIGLSHRHGQSEEYPARLIQWRTVHSVGGLEMVTEVADFDTHGEMWKWKTAKPSRIEFSVLPGVVVHARWWQFP